MNLRDLEYLVAVANFRNFRQAAEHCHVSQPTLSNQIKKLEDYLQVKVFERTNRKVMVTDAGERLIESARRILSERDAFLDIAKKAGNPFAGILRLGAFPTIAPYAFPDIVPAIKKAMPDMDLYLYEEKTDHLLTRLRSGQLDVAILALPIGDPTLEEVPLIKDPFFVLVRKDHPLAKRKFVRMIDLKAHRLLLLEEGHCLRDQALEVCHLANAQEDREFRATSLETLKEMVKAGLGITLIPGTALKSASMEGLCLIPFEGANPHRTLGLVFRRASTRPQLTKRLADIVKSALSKADVAT